MGEILTVADIRRSSWRDDYEEQKTRRLEKQDRELAEARKVREAEKAREAAETQRVASTDWYAAVDARVRAHFKDWAWAAIDERIDELTQRWWEHEWGVLKDAIGEAMGTIGRKVRDEFKCADEELQRALEAKLAVLEE